MQTQGSRNGAVRAVRFVGLMLTFACTSSLAQVNSWITPGSGNWEEAANWSLGVLPGSSQSIIITNSGWKAVAINPSTPGNFPNSMTVSSLTIQGATNTENTLLLNSFGTAVPLKVLNGCSIGAYSAVDNFGSSFEVDGALDMNGGDFVQVDGVTVVNGGTGILNGNFNATNGNVTLTGGLIIGSIFDVNSSHAVQDGGSLLAQQIDIREGGDYKLVSGVLYALNGTECSSGGSFLQTGGTNYGDISAIGTSSYHLQSGMVQGSLMSLANASFEEDAGLLRMQTLHLSGGSCMFSNGIVGCGTLQMTFYSVVTQSGGQFFLTNNFDLHGVSESQSTGLQIIPNTFVLHGGEFHLPSMSLGDYGILEQDGGSIEIGGDLTMTGGTYTLLGGTLAASNISVGGVWIIGDSATNRINNPGSITLSHVLVISNAFEQLGHFILASGATIDLAGSASRLSFANSSGEAWAGGATLVISNWNGNASGSGAEQLKFGNNASGLTAGQLSEIQFSNPAGLPSGTYSAKILSTGEVVPDSASSTPGLVNSWVTPGSGNWDQAANWSLGVLPDNSQSVFITNSVWKAVAINASTPIDFPGSMTVSNLTIGGATNTYNTLLLNSVGAGSPLVIGVSSNAPGKLIIDTNSAVAMFSSGLIVNNALGTNNSHLGEFEVGGNFIQSDGSEVVAGFMEVGRYGTYNLTNSELFVGSQFISGRFNQQGGRNLGAVIFAGSGQGEYDLFDGILQGGVKLDGTFAGVFKQWGGTNIGSLDLGGPGIYQLSGGVLLPGDLQVGPSSLDPSSLGAGAIEQTGGTNNAGNITMGVGSYTLNGGVLTASSLLLPPTSSRYGYAGSSFYQGGGYFTNGGVNMNGVTDQRNGLQPSIYTLNGGELDTPSITMNQASFNHYGGTNRVGILSISNSPAYVINSGLLAVDQIVLMSSSFSNNSGTMTGTRNLMLGNGSYWNEWHAAAQFGQFQLAGANTSSFLNLLGSPCVLRFANSSGVPWSSGGRLTIPNWSGSLNGGGNQQLFFGTSAAGLTPQQLSRVGFVNPAGLPNGTYPARILSTGEVVPDQGSSSNSGSVNSWITPGNGNWDQASNWSLGVLPNNSQLIMITNPVSKAVAINPSTPVNFPGSMTVSNLFIQGATNTENTLLLNNFGTAIPLTILNGLTLQDGAQILNFNSGLVVQSGTITITNSQIVQDGGFVRTTNAQMNLTDSSYNLTNGDFKGGQVTLGYPVPAQFNQYGGSVTISSLIFGRNVFGSGGHYSLYGGNLNLPGGMDLETGNNSTSSYLQSGGTNVTGSVFMAPGQFGNSPSFTFNGGLLVDDNVTLEADGYGAITLTQNGGTHVITNALNISGASDHGVTPIPGTYSLNGGTLSAGSMSMDASMGTAQFNQTNGIASVGEIQGVSAPFDSYWVPAVNLSGGTLACLNIHMMDGGDINQNAGTLIVSNSLAFDGFIQPGPKLYSTYSLWGGTLIASNINIGGDWIIGDSTTNRISNPGTCTLSHTLLISNAVEQLGRFILASNATINLAGTASKLSFANSSAENWAGGAILNITNWNGALNGGGTEQLKFGNNASGLTAGQLSQVQFSNPAGFAPGSYSAQILSTGEVVPASGSSAATVEFTQQGNNLVLTWPDGWALQTSTNVTGPFEDLPEATPPYTNSMSDGPQRFFRLRQ
jgi:hypothetical protein